MIGKKEAEAIIRDHHAKLLDTLSKEEWSAAFEKTKAYAKSVSIYEDLSFADVLRICRTEQEKRLPPEEKNVSASLGITIMAVKQKEERFMLETSAGPLSLKGEDLLSKSGFRRCVLEQTGVLIPNLTPQAWETSLATIIEMNVQDTDESLSTQSAISEALVLLEGQSDERDLSFLRMHPILKNGALCFRLSQLTGIIKKELDKNPLQIEVVETLKKLGYVSKNQDGVRYWTKDDTSPIPAV